MSRQVLHLDFISLSPDAGPDAGNQLLEAAWKLSELPQVETIGAIEADAASDSDFDLAVYFLLPDFTALEPFGTDTRYAGFLQGAVAPRLKAFAGIDVQLDSDFAATGSFASCLALIAPEETYDWEVREALQSWCGLTPETTSIVGLAVGEKQVYRGAALNFSTGPRLPARPDSARFRSTLIMGAARVPA